MTSNRHPPKTRVTPEAVASFRSQLTVGEDVVDPSTWAGSVPVAHGIAPRVRIGQSRWFNLLWLLPIGFVVLIIAIAAAKGLRDMTSVQDFIARNPGTVAPASAVRHPGLPIWVGVQHFFNLFLMMFIIRSGIQILVRSSAALLQSQQPRPARTSGSGCQAGAGRPAVDGQGRFGCATRSAGVAGDSPFHRTGSVVASWRRRLVAAQRRGLLRAVVRYRAMASHRADQLGRVPQCGIGGDPVPVAELADRQHLGGLQRLQLLAYFITVFIAAPLAVITGLGMSPALSMRFTP